MEVPKNKKLKNILISHYNKTQKFRVIKRNKLKFKLNQPYSNFKKKIKVIASN
jgi:curli biogenesis system outer membrane secretion channel CsgG